MGQACKKLPDSFCFDAYVKVFDDLSVVWYVWQPPGSPTPQLERFISSQLILNRSERKRLESVFEWADRTDPGGKKRTGTVKRIWNERAAGETIVQNLKVRPAL
jgi:hypothetical protein